jgi:hypothetical protein
MKNLPIIMILCALTVVGCTRINLQPVTGPLSEIKPVPIVNGTAWSLKPASAKIRFRMPDGQSCSARWNLESKLIACKEGTTVALGMRADAQPTIIGLARDNERNILALRTELLVRPRIIQFCMDESISYASGMASCLEEGKSEDQCDLENAEAASAEVACWMREMEGHRTWIVDLLRLPIPPRPDPIPPLDR